MPSWRDSDDPPEPGPFEPPPPPHVVNPWRFPAPSEEQLTWAIGDKELAYLASLVLLRADPEIRVLAALLVRLFEEQRP
jgi:hypothetical protein